MALARYPWLKNGSSPEGGSITNPMSDKTKEDLEREKLAIELQTYKDRLVLEENKARLEILKLERDARSRYQWIKSVGLTTLVSLITFAGGILYQSRSDVEKEAQEKFSQILVALGNSDPSQRASAADALIPYLTDSKEQSRGSNAVMALTDRLMTDGDLSNKEHYSRSLRSAGDFLVPVALNEMVRVNRVSATQLGRAAGKYVAIRLENPERQLEDTDCNSLSLSNDPKIARMQEDQRKWLQDLQDVVLRSIMPFEAEYATGGSELPRFDPLPLLQTPEVQSAYQLQCRYTFQVRRDQFGHSSVGRAASKLEEDRKAIRDSQDALLVASQNVAATSLTLLGMLRRVSGKQKDWHLERIAIVGGDLDNLDLSEVHLNGAFIQGTALGFKCKKCDLSYGEFGYLRLSQCADLRDSNVDGMKIDYEPAYRIDLRGTDWRKAFKFAQNDPIKQVHLDQIASPEPACESQKSSR